MPGRESGADIVVFKSNGLAAWDVAIAAELSGARASAASGDRLADADLLAGVGDQSFPIALMISGRSSSLAR